MMKNFVIPLVIASLLCACCQTADDAKVRKAVYIVVDGIPADVIERMEPATLTEISKAGGYTQAYCGGIAGTYNETPTISAVGYADILYSAWANKHNVWDNSPKVNYNYWSLFRIAKNQEKPATTGLFSSWTDNRTVVIGAERPENGNFKIDYVADGFDLDTVNFPHEADDHHIWHYDEASVFNAVKCIREKGPDFSWVYLWYTDEAGHLWGNGEQLDKSVTDTDKLIEKIWNAVKYRESNFNEEWLFIVATDHGRGENGYGHGGQSNRERTCWIVSNHKDNGRFGTSNMSLADINPSICNYLCWKVPKNVLWEQDGIPFLGKADIDEIKIAKDGDKITLSWTPLTNKGKVKIHMAETNDFAVGKEDRYEVIGTAKVADGTFTCIVPDNPEFLKFVVEAPNNHLNCWLK